jgi:hypothetical protein
VFHTCSLIHTFIYPYTPNSCLYLINAFSLLIDASEALTDIGGLAARLAELLLALEAGAGKGGNMDASSASVAGAPAYTPPVLNGSSSSSGAGDSTSTSSNAPLMTIEGLSLRLPDGRWLLRDFGLTVRSDLIRYTPMHTDTH